MVACIGRLGFKLSPVQHYSPRLSVWTLFVSGGWSRSIGRISLTILKLLPMNHEILENMTIALKPKMISQGLGDAGVKDTFLSIVKSAEKLDPLP